MRPRLTIPLLAFAFSTLALSTSISKAPPIMGLSTILGVSVLGSSVLGSSVLGSSVLGSSVLGSSVLGSSVLGSSVLASTTIVEAYSSAIPSIQPWLSLSLIILLVYMELTDPSSGGLRGYILELRRGWMPVSGLLLLLFLIIVALRVWSILV